MKWYTSEEFMCTRLGGQSYLLPYGQKIADFYAGLKINEAGVLLWRAMEGGAEEEELLELLCGHCQAEEEEAESGHIAAQSGETAGGHIEAAQYMLDNENICRPKCITSERIGIVERKAANKYAREYDGDIRRDLADFLRQLADRGAARAEQPEGHPLAGNPAHTGGPARCRFFCAGSLRIAYEGPETVFERYFKAFGCEAGEPDQKVAVRTGRPFETANGRVLLRNGELILMEGKESYIMLFPAFREVYELHVKKDGRECCVYCSPRMSEEEQEDIFHVIRFAFLVLAQNRGLCVVHSASLLYRERAWLFSGKSGTGKSTHVNLWREAYGTPPLNGDLNCLGLEGDRVWVYGLPWCGTSGIATPKAYPLGGVVFLRQWRENEVQELTEAEKACALAMRMITPTWTEELLHKNLRLAEEIVRRCMSVRLCCTRETEAAGVMRRYIDLQMDG